MALKEWTGPRWVMSPMASSIQSSGMPTSSSITVQGSKKLAPPDSYTRQGKRQIFPKPTQQPMQASKNSALLFHASRMFNLVPWGRRTSIYSNRQTTQDTCSRATIDFFFTFSRKSDTKSPFLSRKVQKTFIVVYLLIIK